MNRYLLVFLVSTAALFAGCDLLAFSAGRQVQRTDDEDRLARLEREIETEIGVPHASSTDQCRTIAFGSKPCGGPWRYLVYSTEVTDPETLEKLVADYNALQAEINEENEVASDCMYVVDPGATLEDDICVLRRE